MTAADMFLPVVLALVTAFVLEGTGNFILKKLKIENRLFAFPAGIAGLFMVMEGLLIPFLCINMPLNLCSWIIGAVLIAAVVLAVLDKGEFLKNFGNWWMPAIIVSLCLYLYVWYRSIAGNTFGSDMEMAVIRSMAETGKTGMSYLRLQGYDVFAALLVKVFHSEMKTALYLGTLFHLTITSCCADFIRTFRINNPWFRFTITAYCMAYTSMNRWMILSAYQGNSWRIIFLSLMLWCAYCYIKDGNEQEKYMLIAYASAGMFVSRGFCLMTFEIMYCLGVYLFSRRKIRSLFDIMTLLIPSFIYWGAFLGKKEPAAGIALAAVYLFLIYFRYQTKPRRVIAKTEEWLFDHYLQVMVIGVPAFIIVITLGTYLIAPDHVVPYSYYKYFFETDPVRSFVFLEDDWVLRVLDVFRWGALLFLIFKPKTAENDFFRTMFLMMILLFVNPLCMGIYAEIAGTSFYAISFEVMFNPFTDIVLFITIYKLFEWNVIGQWVLEIFLVLAVLIGNVSSMMKGPSGLYTDLLEQAERVSEVGS